VLLNVVIRTPVRSRTPSGGGSESDPEHLQGQALSPIPNTLLGEALSQRSLPAQPYTSPIPNTPLGEL
jgi:hypothetical protein